MDVCSRFGSRDVDDLNDIKQSTLHGCLDEEDNESDADGSSDVAVQLKRIDLGCAILPSVDKFSTPSIGSSSEEDGELGVALRQLFCQEIIETPVKLISAMKGSREKQGLAPKKLSVTWAPDVYDPPPTSALHTIRGRKQQKSRKHNDKKNGKKGHKGNNSIRGGGSRDKKHLRRGCGSSDRCYKSLNVQGTLVVPADDGLDGFHVGSPDSFCGSSFLKRSPTKVHYSVAEAL